MVLGALAIAFAVTGCTSTTWSFEKIDVGGNWKEYERFVPRDGLIRTVNGAFYRRTTSATEEYLIVSLTPARDITGKYALIFTSAANPGANEQVEFYGEVARSRLGLADVSNVDFLRAIAADFSFSTEDAYRREVSRLMAIALLRVAQSESTEPEEIPLFGELESATPRIPPGGASTFTDAGEGLTSFSYRTHSTD